MRKNTIFCLLAAVVLAFSSVGTTMGAWRAVENSDNVIEMIGVRGQVIEQYETASNIYPGNTVKKVVDAKNTGDSDIVVRVKIKKEWVRPNDDGTEETLKNLSTDNILIEYNTERWLYDTDDGYFYYKGVLEPGEITTVPLFKEFSIDVKSGNEYAGLKANIVVRMECVQAEAQGISIWNKTFLDLGITYTPKQHVNRMTRAVFENPENGFTFTPRSTDLFANFKSLLPGESRSQEIEVKNNYTRGTEIFLHAEYVPQTLSPGKEEEVNELLRDHATIVVTDDKGEIYNGSILGEAELESRTPESMKEEISLGKFSTGESKELHVQLQIDSDIDSNKYSDIAGLVRWVWSAEGAETPVKVPQTGDTYRSLFICGGIMLLSAGVLIVLLVYRKKEKNKN